MKIWGNDFYLGAYLERCGKDLVDRDNIFSPQPEDYVYKPQTFSQSDEVSQDWHISDQYGKLETAYNMSGAEFEYNMFYDKLGFNDYHFETTENQFQVKGVQQWLVFSEKLYNDGFFDDMSDEEVRDVERLLVEITSSVDVFHAYERLALNRNIGGFIHPEFTYIDRDTYKDMGGEEWQMLLESGRAALRYFNQNFVAAEHQAEFDALIDEFYQYNSSVFDGYQSVNERRMQLFMAQSYQPVQKTEEEPVQEENFAHLNWFTGQQQESGYVDALKAYFGQLAASQGAGTKALLSQLDSDNSVMKSEHLEKRWGVEMEQDMRLEKYKKQIQSYWETLSNMYEMKYKDNGADKAEE